MKNEELLPCPFCGRKGELLELSGGYIASCYYSDVLNALEDGVPSCPMNIDTILTTKEVAIKIWNRRNHYVKAE